MTLERHKTELQDFAEKLTTMIQEANLKGYIASARQMVRIRTDVELLIGWSGENASSTE